MESEASKPKAGPLQAIPGVVDLTREIFARFAGFCLPAAALAAAAMFAARTIFGVVVGSAEGALQLTIAAAALIGAVPHFKGAGVTALAVGPVRLPISLPGLVVAAAAVGLAWAVRNGIDRGADTVVDALLNGWLVVFAGWLFVVAAARAVGASQKPAASPAENPGGGS